MSEQEYNERVQEAMRKYDYYELAILNYERSKVEN